MKRRTVYGCFCHDMCSGVYFDEALVTDDEAKECGVAGYEPVMVFESEHNLSRDNLRMPWALKVGDEAWNAERVVGTDSGEVLRVLWRTDEADRFMRPSLRA